MTANGYLQLGLYMVLLIAAAKPLGLVLSPSISSLRPEAVSIPTSAQRLPPSRFAA